MTAPALKKVLIVEDDDDIRHIAQLALETVGQLQVESCASGSEALQTAPSFEPDLILMDVMMPDLDGPSTLNALRSNQALAMTPAVFMTAKVMPDEIESYKELGAIDVISKPFDPMTLPEQLKNIWNELYD